MKKILSIVALVLVIYSCSKDEECNCTLMYMTEHNSTIRYVGGMPIDCESERPLKDVPGVGDVIPLGCQQGTKITIEN